MRGALKIYSFIVKRDLQQRPYPRHGGVNGVSIVGHGSAKAEGVQRAIGMARFSLETEFISKLNEELAEIRAKVGDNI